MIAFALLSITVVLLVFTEGFFSGSETVFTSASKAFLQDRAEQGDERAVSARTLLAKTERFLGTTLMGTNLAVVSSTSLCQIIVSRYILSSNAFQAFTEAVPIPWQWENLINTIIMTPLILLFGEFLPKSVGRAHADPLALRLSKPLKTASVILSPLVWVFGHAAGFLAQVGGASNRSALKPHVTRDDLKTIAEMAAEQGLVPETAGSMLQTVFEIDTKPVSTMMVPLVDVASVPIDATIQDVETLAVRTGFARFPVYQNRVDDIVGIVSLRQLLYLETDPDGNPVGADTPIRPYVKANITFIPESKAVGGLLHELRYQHTPMAVVVDEHGGVTGILTLEDLVEEIVGDIQDERDRPAEPLRRVEESVFECEGRLEIRELEEHLGMEIEHNGFETAAGLVLKVAGRIPAKGERFRYRDYTIDILEVVGRRISRLRFQRIPEDQSP